MVALDGYCQAYKVSDGQRCTRKAKDNPRWCTQHAEPIKWLDPLLAHETRLETTGTSRVIGGIVVQDRRALRGPATRDVIVEIDRVELGSRAAYAMDLEWYDAQEQLTRVFDMIDARRRAAEWERQEGERRQRDSERRRFIDSELHWAHEHGIIWCRTFSRERQQAGGVRHMTRFISPRRRWAETLCGLSVTVQRCSYDEIYKIKTCSQCQHAFHMEQAGLPVPEHPIEATRRPAVQAALVTENRYPRQNGEKTVPYNVRQFFDKKVAEAVAYLEKHGTVKDDVSAVAKLGKKSGIGETIAGAVVGHLITLNMVEVTRETNRGKGRADAIVSITLRPEAEWLDEKPDFEAQILTVLADAGGGLGDTGGQATRLLLDVGGFPFSSGHLRHLLEVMDKDGRIKRLTTGRRTLWIGLPDGEVPDDVQARYDAWYDKQVEEGKLDLGEVELTDDGVQYLQDEGLITTDGELTEEGEELLAAQPTGAKPGVRVSLEDCRQAVDAYNQAGTIRAAGELLGIHATSVKRRLKAAREHYGLEVDVAPPGGRRGPRNAPVQPEPTVGELEAMAAEVGVHVPDRAPALDAEELDYDQLADSMLNRVGHYLAQRDEVIMELRAKLTMANDNGELAKLKAEVRSLKQEKAHWQDLAEDQRKRAKALERDLAAANERIAELTKPKVKAAGVSENAKRGVLGVAQEFLRGNPKSGS